MPSRRTIAARTILRERGPLHLDELGRRMAESGATRAKDSTAAAREVVRWQSRYLELRDGRWMDRVAALDGAVLRHRVSRHERKVGALRMDPDLSVLGTVADAHDLRSVAGPVEVAVSWIRDSGLDPRFPAPDRFLVLPYEVGRRLQPGVVVAVLVTGDTFDVLPVAPSSPGAPSAVIGDVAAELLRDTAAGWPGTSVRIEDLMFEALARAPDLLRVATEPVGDMIRRCGLADHRDLATAPLTNRERIAGDTHAFLWWMGDDARLSPRARAVLADRDNTVALSAASAWEIGIKVARGRLRVPLSDGRLVAAVVQEEDLERLDIAFDHVLAALSLPPIHRDPFDRILVAQARTLGCPILTADPLIARYEVEVVW